jgi:pyrroline-5-carboxylate reductase
VERATETGAAALRKLAVIGGGKMGGAIASRVVGSGLLPPDRVVISEPVEAVRRDLGQRLGVATMFDHRRAVEGASSILFSVVPQVVSVAGGALRGHLTPDQVVISIAAGVEIQTLEAALGHPAIIRVMPNTPAQVGQGISAWYAPPAVTEGHKAQARAILGTIGRELEVDQERYLDMVTALSASGPAWVMLVVEALKDAGVQIGLRPEWAYDLALQTLAGSVAWARETGKHPAELRNLVTTPAGTTAAGLYAMERAGLRGAIAAGIVAAYERCLELGAAARAAQAAQAESR